MLIEKATRVNVFGLLGGVRAVAEVREGTIRANGPFQHAILGGCFGATLLPLCYLLFKEQKAKAVSILGMASATLIVVCSGSSTPLLAYVTGVAAIAFWPVRRQMRTLRLAFVLAVVGLQCVMKADVWWLIARVDLVGGSSSYHRAALIDTCIKHFWDWWLIGTDQMAKWGWDMWDLSNQFVAEAETGGLAVLVCFLAAISKAYGKLGDARKAAQGKLGDQWFVWIIGASFTAQMAAFFGVNYWDQMLFTWLALLAIVAAATVPGPRRAKTETGDAREVVSVWDQEGVTSGI
jgi:hypothetical protein